MKLTINVDLNNAAFEDGGTFEVAEILSQAANKIGNSGLDFDFVENLRDSNGNTVGFVELSLDTDD